MMAGRRTRFGYEDCSESDMSDERSILVVDHDSDSIDRYADRLASWGFKVYAANTGMEALLTLQNVRANLVLLNLDLRGMSGLAVSRGVIQDRLTCHVPVLAVSPNVDESRKNALSAIGAHFLDAQKADSSELLNVIEDILESHEVRKA